MKSALSALVIVQLLHGAVSQINPSKLGHLLVSMMYPFIDLIYIKLAGDREIKMVTFNRAWKILQFGFYTS